MWLSEQFCKTTPPEVSGFGEVTISGGKAAAKDADREQRLLPLVSPGGFVWLPDTGDQVLVLREGAPCIIGRIQPEQRELSPGEVMLYAGSGSIRLRKDGTIELTGKVIVNGQVLGGNTNGE
ncbi:MAG: hypothetical protein E7464_03790 [Ruminococcaceae bacterium]|nr:hypothetical protein [Oscillospiraceae bacterium]